MSSLTTRYITATLAGVPESQRSDVDAELRASIADAVDARVDQGESAEQAERQVLNELGDPSRLAASYSDRRLYLIGPDLFLDYRRVLIALLSVVVPLVAVTAFIVTAVVGTATLTGNLVDALVGAIVTALNTALQVAFWTTLAFAIVERAPQRGRIRPVWSVERLPIAQAPKNRADAIGAIVVLVIFIGALVWQQFAPIAYVDGLPVREPVLEPGLWSSWLLVILGILAAQIVLTAFAYRHGRWTWGYLTGKFALELTLGLTVIALAATGQLLNPAFFAELGWTGGAEGRSLVSTAVIASTVFVNVWAAIDYAIKLRRTLTANRAAGHDTRSTTSVS